MKRTYAKDFFWLLVMTMMANISSAFGQETKWISFKDEILKWTYQIPDYLEDRRKNPLSPHNFVRNSKKMPIDKCVQCVLNININIEDLEGENLNEVR